MNRQKFKRGNKTPHIRLDHWFYDCASWQALKPAPRALYLELKRRFNGSNNGQIFLSHRDAAKKLNVGRDTIGRYYDILVEHGFITQTRGHCLGPSGIGQSAAYALTELPLDEKPATKDFMQQKKQNPSRKIQHSLARKSSHPCRKIQPLNNQMSENTAALGRKQPDTVLENPAIYTSNHIPTAKLGTKHKAKSSDAKAQLGSRFTAKRVFENHAIINGSFRSSDEVAA